MNEVLATFEERVEELEKYYIFLDQVIDGPDKSEGIKPHSELDGQLQKILKANAFLHIYNLVESSIKNGFQFVFSEIYSHQLIYSALSSKLKEIWLNGRFSGAYTETANRSTWRNLATSILSDVVDEAPVTFTPKALVFSGNLDARKIREVCRQVGVCSQTGSSGEELQLVKKRRNALAHGSLSFSEVGREHSLQSLVLVKDEVVNFLREILENIERFVSDQKFLEPKKSQ